MLEVNTLDVPHEARGRALASSRKDHRRQKLVYVQYEEEPGNQSAANQLTSRDEPGAVHAAKYGFDHIEELST